MSIGTIETFSTFGALDSTAIPDGGPVASYVLRTIALDNNRLVGKGHMMAGLWWPSRDTIDLAEGDTAYNYEGTSALSWRLIHPTIIVPKKPGLTTASVRMTALTPTAGDIVRFQFVTLGTGGRLNITANPNDSNVVEFTGTGGWDDVDLDDLPIDAGPYETISIYVQGGYTARISSEATFGTPTDHDGSTGITSVFASSDTIGRMSYSSAAWNSTEGDGADLASAGAWIVFKKQDGTPIAAPRQIVNMPGTASTTNVMEFRPPLTHPEYIQANDAVNGHAFTIYDAPRWAISNIAIKADDK